MLKGVANAMPIFEKTVRTLGDARQFQYDVHDMMMALVYARAIFPASKKKTHEDILYIGIVFERLLESFVLGNRFGYEKIIDFVRSFTLVRLDSKNY